jgi:hypothetical protein
MGGIEVNVNVGDGVKVAAAVGVSDSNGACVNVGSGVLMSPDGWNGVGVGDAFGSRVIRIKVGKTGGAEGGVLQDARRAKSKK